VQCARNGECRGGRDRASDGQRELSPSGVQSAEQPLELRHHIFRISITPTSFDVTFGMAASRRAA
jgi:hypothetical protein